MNSYDLHRRGWVGLLILAAVLALPLVSFAQNSSVGSSGHEATTPSDLSQRAEAIRNELGIPPDAERVLFLSETAHMDWDWLNWFPTNVDDVYPPDHQCQVGSCYFGGSVQPADTILQRAYNSLQTFPDYYYSTCEVGFLRAFAENPKYVKYFEAMRKSGRYRVVGGGITSPDNLLPAGETFFRNFLVANTWMRSVDLPWTRQVWLPDDFGHDSELPVMLEALGAEGVGFSRVPGGVQQQNLMLHPPNTDLTTKQALQKDVELGGGIDFIWRGSDGSTTFAHFLPQHYSQGADISTECYKSQIQVYLFVNGPASPSPYVYVPVSNDFLAPLGGTDPPTPPERVVLEAADAWNSSPPSPFQNVWVVMGTFDQYATLVLDWQQRTQGLRTRSFQRWDQIRDLNTAFLPTPYWMGFYASRPENKRLHHAATRAMLGAESFDAIGRLLLGESPVGQAKLFAAWNDLVPSTHHDYITGTANDYTYNGEYGGERGEQLVLLEATTKAADELRTTAIGALASQIGAEETLISVFNQLGYERRGIVQMTPGNAGLNVPQDFRCPQQTAEGGCIAFGSSPSLGYRTRDELAIEVDPGPVSVTTGSDTITLENDEILARVNLSDFTLEDVRSQASGSSNVLSAAANQIAIYQDGGGIYRYGYEMDKTFTELDLTTKASDVRVLEDGPIRARLAAKITMTTSPGLSPQLSGPLTYDLEYSIVVGEPMVRVKLVGLAPGPPSNDPSLSTEPSLFLGSSVMVKFPLTEDIDGIHHGTPYHWTTKTPWNYSTSPHPSGFAGVFEATHDFVIPLSGTEPLAAIYHGGVPAWAAQGNTLYGTVLRNTPTNGSFGARGHDPDRHEVEYAFRIPTGLDSPASGMPLREARAYATPLAGVAIAASEGPLPRQFSLASVSATGAGAVITAAKEGTVDPSSLVLRLYQPTNSALDVELHLADQLGPTTQRAVTALELETGDGSPVVGRQLSLKRAVTTLEILEESDQASSGE